MPPEFFYTEDPLLLRLGKRINHTGANCQVFNTADADEHSGLTDCRDFSEQSKIGGIDQIQNFGAQRRILADDICNLIQIRVVPVADLDQFK